MKIAITVTLCLAALMASAALAADRTVTVTPVEGPVQSVLPSDAAGVCIFGNHNAAAYAITDFIWGGESYASVFRAQPAGCPTCNVGFTVEQVHFYMNFTVADVPASFNVTASFYEAEGAGCAAPTAEVCTSPVYQVGITNPGLYDIALPLGTCACAYFDYDYAVTINFPDAFPATMRPDAVTDNVPVGCTSYNDYGSGWSDLNTLGFPGELVMFADIICCEPAVPDGEQSWGSLKSLYR